MILASLLGSNGESLEGLLGIWAGDYQFVCWTRSVTAHFSKYLAPRQITLLRPCDGSELCVLVRQEEMHRSLPRGSGQVFKAAAKQVSSCSFLHIYLFPVDLPQQWEDSSCCKVVLGPRHSVGRKERAYGAPTGFPSLTCKGSHLHFKDEEIEKGGGWGSLPEVPS